MSQTLEKAADVNDFLCVVICCTGFRLRRGCDHMSQCLVLDKDGSVEDWWCGGLWSIGELVETSDAATGTGKNEICSVRIDMQDHIGCTIRMKAFGYVAK